MTPPDDVSTRLAEIRERVEAATEGPAVERMIEAVFRHGYGRGGAHEDRGEWRPEDEAVEYVEKAPYPVEELCRYARSDVPYLLSLVEEVGEALGAIPDPFMDTVLQSVEKHAGYEAARELARVRDAALKAEYDAALRDAAQEGAE